MFSFLKGIRTESAQPEPPTPPLVAANAVPLRGYKVCNTERSRKYGVAANSLEMLRTKAALKLKINDPRVYVAKDGTEVSDEDYFCTLAPQTLLVIASQDELVATDVELIYASIRSHFASDAGRLVQSFVNANRAHFAQLLGTMQTTAAGGGGVAIDEDDNTEDNCGGRLVLCSKRSEHADWFSGHPPAMDTKEKVMRRRSQDRIRGYYYRTKDELLRSELYRRCAAARPIIDRTLAVFAHLLAEADHFGQLFNRTWPVRHASLVPAADGDTDSPDGDTAAASSKKRRRLAVQSECQRHDVFDGGLLVALCDERGQFRCQGLWNRERCAYAAAGDGGGDGDGHFINPYASREAAILFQIWNLDHGVEMARTIIPDLLRTVRFLVGGSGGDDGDDDEATLRCSEHRRRGCDVAMLRYFRELFTVDNLRLVHIVCHDKSVHEGRLSAGGVVCDRCAEFQAVRDLCAAVRMV